MVCSTIFQCDDCAGLFTSKTALKRHIWGHLNIRCICRICKKRFTTKQNAFTHVKNIHRSYTKWTPMWHCGICSSFINDVVIDVHVEHCLRRKKNDKIHSDVSRVAGKTVKLGNKCNLFYNAGSNKEYSVSGVTKIIILGVIGILFLVLLVIFFYL